MLNKIDWKENTLLLDNLEFALQVHLKDDIRKETTGFVFYKDKKLIDMYEAFFKS